MLVEIKLVLNTGETIRPTEIDFANETVSYIDEYLPVSERKTIPAEWVKKMIFIRDV